MQPLLTKVRSFTVQYSFVGRQRLCEVKEAEGKTSLVYKCRLLPSAIEITVKQIKVGNCLQWTDSKGIVNDLAKALGKAIEQHFIRPKINNQY